MFIVGRRRFWESGNPPFQSMRIVLVRPLPFSQIITTSLVFTETQQTHRVQAEAGGGRCGGEWMKGGGGGGGGGKSTVIWRFARRVNTAAQLRYPVGVHQESYFLINLPLFTTHYLFFCVEM